MMSTPLSEASFDILLSLASGPAHGYAMTKEIERRRAGRKMQPGLMYTTLPKLLAAGLIERAKAPPGDTDKRRRYYQLSTAGRMAVMEEADRRVVAAAKIRQIAGGMRQELA